MGLILLAVINASIFSIGGIGEDMSVFRSPFLDVREMARIEFSLRPEFNILNKGSDYRGIFWTNPFNFSVSIPVIKGFVFGVGNCERFNQSFDVYYEQDDLEMHLNGNGGIEEVYANLNNSFGVGEIAFKASYLFGNASEVWDYSIGNYYLVDSFAYKYQGKIFCAGVRIKFVSVFYEFLGDVEMEKTYSDTTIGLPSRLSIDINPEILGNKINIVYEHSFWQDNSPEIRSPNRFRLSFAKKMIAIGYEYNPWYLESVVEHGLDFSLNIPIRKMGLVSFNLGCSLRNKDSLREINITPGIKLKIQELFARRRK